MKKYTYIVVRKDMPVNVQMVQAAHVACTAGETFKNSDSNFVLVGVENNNILIELAEELFFNHVKYVMFNEPDNNIGYSSLATDAYTDKNTRKTISKIFKKLNIKLWEV